MNIRDIYSLLLDHSIELLIIFFGGWIVRVVRKIFRVISEIDEQKVILIEMMESIELIRETLLSIQKRFVVTDRAISDISGRSYDSEAIAKDEFKYPKIHKKKVPPREH